jgi:hypothetical protein
VQGAGCRVQGAGCRVQEAESRGTGSIYIHARQVSEGNKLRRDGTTDLIASNLSMERMSTMREEEARREGKEARREGKGSEKV